MGYRDQVRVCRECTHHIRDRTRKQGSGLS
jgi:hypothetical protein